MNRLRSITENKQDTNRVTSGTLQRFLEDVGVNSFIQILHVSFFRSATWKKEELVGDMIINDNHKTVE